MLTIEALRRPGLHPFDLKLDAGQCLGVNGASGSGKTLMLRAIADLDPNQGSVTLDGRDRTTFDGPAWRRLVAYLPAESGWWAARVGDHFPDGDNGLTVELGLPAGIMNRTVLDLSTGERQRLALVRTVMRDPAVLLLDEPTSGLDPHGVERVEAVLGRLLTDGKAMLLVTHDAAQVGRLAHERRTMTNGLLSEAMS
ncbi:ATP-binding cassette domain-containing protein [Magnetospira sp. QH-2]|uniref:ABC transporter ATP-binding protein n=1 Tax=Magnetospira sp. (strain QH-2) TaxID=1288970 RepID=UPI0003E80AC8|nr:ATP-binding cassette domain-containing protein [Magnetospira sp. QH-2]CCQ72484.1 putative ABC transporter, ATPase subunit [Magnetospira sp. QH-2]